MNGRKGQSQWVGIKVIVAQGGDFIMPSDKKQKYLVGLKQWNTVIPLKRTATLIDFML
jgi:hypothetical protein